MAAKETIAIVGATGKTGSEIAYKLAAQNYRLLLMSTNADKVTRLSENIKTTFANAEVETADCLKEGCWEADIVILAVPAEAEQMVAKKIKEVATQKIVVHFLNAKNDTSIVATDLQKLQRLLPWTKIVTIVTNTTTSDKTAITGADEEAVETIVSIAAKAGFNVTSMVEL